MKLASLAQLLDDLHGRLFAHHEDASVGHEKVWVLLHEGVTEVADQVVDRAQSVLDDFLSLLAAANRHLDHFRRQAIARRKLTAELLLHRKRLKFHIPRYANPVALSLHDRVQLALLFEIERVFDALFEVLDLLAG